MAEKQQPLRILAFGDSLTAGYYNSGRAHHPYAKHLAQLFESANIPVQIDQRGINGERVLPIMVARLRNVLKKNAPYDWVIILGGTNDLAYSIPAENIFNEGLKAMYDMCLHRAQAKIRVAAMTVIENKFNSPMSNDDQNRQALNKMIRDYVPATNEQDRICLVDLDKGIPYHSATNDNERAQIWDDAIHLKPAGYDRMATLVFDAIKNKL